MAERIYPQNTAVLKQWVSPLNSFPQKSKILLHPKPFEGQLRFYTNVAREFQQTVQENEYSKKVDSYPESIVNNCGRIGMWSGWEV
jgi:hypothetical protein